MANKSSGVSVGGSITTANLSQVISAANAYRGGIKFQNTSDTDIWLNPHGGAAAVGVGFKIVPSAIVDIPSSLGIAVLCTVIGKTFAALEI
jgi:hypothetical protein